MSMCPCGSGSLEAACCGPILDGVLAPTALALMRSRYVAYVRRAVDYLIDTQDPASRAGVDREAIARWSRDTTWLGLEIVAIEGGGAQEEEGIVEFIARGATRGAPFAQHERSRFRQRDGRWYYLDGKVIRDPIQSAAAPGRNDPCPCGSGMKYKRCHGA